MNELVTGGLWEPERVKWDHHKIEDYIENNWKNESDEELAESLSEMTGKNIVRSKVKDKRLDMGIDRSEYVRKHMDYSNMGGESVIDWQSPEVIKYVQTRYQDKTDLEMARGLSERFDVDVSYEMVRKHRLRMGYKREAKQKKREFDLDVPKYRRFIYENHPKFQGEGQIIDFVVDFYDKFDPPITLRSLKRNVERFIEKDGKIKLMKPINKSEMNLCKIERWLNLP